MEKFIYKKNMDVRSTNTIHIICMNSNSDLRETLLSNTQAHSIGRFWIFLEKK